MKMRTYRISVDGRKRIKMKTMTKNIAGACVGSMGKEFNLRHNMQFYCFQMFSCAWLVENVSKG